VTRTSRILAGAVALAMCIAIGTAGSATAELNTGLTGSAGGTRSAAADPPPNNLCSLANPKLITDVGVSDRREQQPDWNAHRQSLQLSVGNAERYQIEPHPGGHRRESQRTSVTVPNTV